MNAIKKLFWEPNCDTTEESSNDLNTNANNDLNIDISDDIIYESNNYTNENIIPAEASVVNSYQPNLISILKNEDDGGNLNEETKSVPVAYSRQLN